MNRAGICNHGVTSMTQHARGVKIDRMELKSTFSWDVGELAEKRKAARMAELETYSKESAPEGENFDLDKGLALLLHNVKCYEAALLRIAEKAEEHHALMEHRQKTGQEVPASDLQRFFAYLKSAHIAAEALARPGLIASLKNLEGESR
jgi:hypothetical protein